MTEQTAVEKFDIKETKEFYEFFCSLVNALDVSLSDGKITFSDTFNFVATLPTIRTAVEGVRKMPLELSDLSDSEIDILDKLTGEKLKLSNTEVALLSQNLNRGALEFAQIINNIRSIRASRK